MTPKRIHLLNTPLDAVDATEALAIVDAWVEKGGQSKVIMAINPEKIYTLKKDPFLNSFARNADLLIPDGIGVVLAARLLCNRSIKRVAGADLFHRICKAAAQKGYGLYLYGARESVSIDAAEDLQNQYPGLRISGRTNGYINADQMADLVRDINRSGTDILGVALGSPRQEEWIAEYRSELNVKVIQGIGGTLDTITGHVKRAPLFWQKMALEWLYRLVSEPRRLKRQIVLPLFALQVIQEKIKS